MGGISTVKLVNSVNCELASKTPDFFEFIQILNRHGVASVNVTFILSPWIGYYEVMTTHNSHPDIVKRLKRAEGHLKSVLIMLEEGRDCLDIAQQLQAVESAVGNAKKTLVHDHIDHCLQQMVRDGTQSADDTIREFKAITKYL